MGGEIETVSTVSIIVPLQFIPLHKQLKLFRKTLLSMVLFLICDVFCYLPNARLRDRKCAISSPPPKFAWQQVALVYPMGRTTLQKLHPVLNAEIGRQINQDMDVFG